MAVSAHTYDGEAAQPLILDSIIVVGAAFCTSGAAVQPLFLGRLWTPSACALLDLRPDIAAEILVGVDAGATLDLQVNAAVVVNVNPEASAELDILPDGALIIDLGECG